MKLSRSHLYRIYLVMLLTTEFYLVDFLDGALRIAHFFAPVVTLLLVREVPKIVRSPVFIALGGFLAVNLLAAAASPTPADALFSYGLLLANASIAISVALILVSGRIRYEQLMQILLVTTLIGIVFGLVQVGLYRYGGIDLALSDSQEQQLAGGFAPAFRYEANAFAKSLNVVFLVWLPVLLSRGRRWIKMTVGLLLVTGMLISLTRSALYGLGITLMFVYGWYVVTGRGKLLSPRLLLLLGFSLLAVATYSSLVGDFNAYAGHKLQFFFDSNEMLHGDSSAFRLMSQGKLWDAFVSSEKSVLLGAGWGQVKFFAYDRIYQAGGAEMIAALAYGGLFGGVMYLFLHYSAIKSAHSAISRSTEGQRIAQGIFFAQLGILITGQINGSLIAPEYWLLFGMSMALPYCMRRLPLSNVRPLSSGEGAGGVARLAEAPFHSSSLAHGS